MIQQYQIAQLLPAKDSAKLSGLLVCYGRAVVGVEWPQLQHGHKPDFNPWGIALFQALQAVQPVTNCPAGGVLEVARPDRRPGAGAARSRAGREQA